MLRPGSERASIKKANLVSVAKMPLGLGTDLLSGHMKEARGGMSVTAVSQVRASSEEQFQ